MPCNLNPVQNECPSYTDTRYPKGGYPMVLHKLIAAIVFLLCVSPLASSKIVFSSDRDGDDYEIYVMDDDGTHIQRLTHHPDKDGTPTWSPNGKQIAFTREKRWQPGQKRQIINICVMYRDGSEGQQITGQNGIYNQPRWSPDGKHIAFDGDGNLHTIDMETQEVKSLLRNLKKEGTINIEDWSPDGKSIAYTVSTFLKNILYTTDPNGNRQIQLLPAKDTYKYSFQWSSDGKKSVYCEATYQGNDLISNKVVILGKRGLLLQKIDMTGKLFMHVVRWMGDHHLLITAEVWSPPNLPSDIYIYTLATGKITNLTNHPSRDFLGDWIDDAALDVLPAGKLSIVWGQLKKP